MDRIVAVDPGGHTGVAFGVRDGSGFKVGKTLEINSLMGDYFCGREDGGILSLGVETVKWLKGRDGVGNGRKDRRILIFEDFVVYPGRSATGASGRSGLSPVWVTGWLLGYVCRSELSVDEVCYQGAGDAKRVVSDDRLRDMGLWVAGSTHIRDALRHAVLWCRKQG